LYPTALNLIRILLIVVTAAISAIQKTVRMAYVCHVLLERQSVLVVLDSVVGRTRTVVIISVQTHNMTEIIVEAVELYVLQISIVRPLQAPLLEMAARVVLQERLYAEVSV